MSARFFKIFSGVFLAHLVVLSLVWVGFSAPGPRPPATFIYEGALPLEDTAGSPTEMYPFRGQGLYRPIHLLSITAGASFFNHWIMLREPSKPYDHLGF